MARFLVTAMPFTGHVAPMIAVAAALVSRGHGVRVYTGAAFRGRVEATGARLVPWSSAPDFDEQDLPATFPRLVGKKGLGQLLVNMEDLFVGTAPGQVADLAAEWEREPWDALVSEETSLGPRLVAERIGCRWATVAIASLNLPSSQGPPPGLGLAPGRGTLGRARDAALRGLVPILAGRLTGPVARARSDAGLLRGPVRFDHLVHSPQLILATGVPALDHRRTDRPGTLRWVGRLALPPAPASAAPLPAWWPDLAGRSVVHVTQGTQNVDPADLLLPALEALAGLDVLVVATTGVRGQHALPFPVPANARVADFVPHDLLLPEVDLVVTNGGWGGVLAALEHGVPLVVAGGDLDKPEVAARVASAGVGLNLRTGRPGVGALRAAVHAALGDDALRARARALATELASAGGAGGAALALEEFVAGPVDLPPREITT
ncbi:glycosyltransferase [Galbitalea sp. SE-J8]|uniref:glycosyltransferase n=1 Tax=Galbitalea sp. SE-J8 TaxID=3054952 RepID=UPI00259CE1F2|nr:glycosyltransferase [Galbitalea sp. SE-J8]MDM4763261.1 glycosyltransferase [Galbitalea sp. SE-J8]